MTTALKSPSEWARMLIFISTLFSACSTDSDKDNALDGGSTSMPTDTSHPPKLSVGTDSHTPQPAPTDTHQSATEAETSETWGTDTSVTDTGVPDTGLIDTDSSDTETSPHSDGQGTDIDDTLGSDSETESAAPLDTETSSDVDTSASTCSPDLHHLVNGSGEVIETCPPDQGCLDGECVPACSAVSAAVGNVGCDFIIPRPSYIGNGNETPCYAVFVANNWNRPSALTLSRLDTTYDVSSVSRIPETGLHEVGWPALPVDGIPADQVAVLFLEGEDCPVTPAVSANTRVVTTGRGNAWHLTTDTPVTVYDILPYGGAESYLPSAGLILPTTSWTTDYLAVLPPFFESETRTIFGGQWGQLVAAEDETVVEIVSPVDLPQGADVISAPAGVATRYSLNRGEYIQWEEEQSIEMEMTGAVISANHPVSFVGGNAYLCIVSATSHDGGCDSAHQQIPPINAWGSRYVVAPFATRRETGEPEALLYRIVGAEDGTMLTFDPPNGDAPDVLRQGEWRNFPATGAFEVRSQGQDHPFYLAQMMPGSEVVDRKPDDMPGDEEYVNLVPSAQFMSSYVFFTDLTYRTTTLTLTQCDAGQTFEDVHLECLDGPVTGWQPVGSDSDCRWTSVDLVRDDIGNGNCQNGPQSAHSEGPFGLTVWGMDYCASYAYPAGALVSKINEIRILII